MLERTEIFETLQGYLDELLEIPPETVTLESRLYEDLDIDSIDAVDLVVRLQDLIGKKIPPADFKAVRTVDDVISCVETVLQK
ncbi:MAG: acyl carrier protein [Rhodospirillaceae bacterium]|nr:acyl carrier protein [Rhodospirillaceae bacterium]MBT6825746.1 acyl carrier protein [Rhodospirillales bacterium]MBT5081465.1 acyl carrier protein [Rhodospirillaceae bacterium]MBT5523065.1 acyl carrier protein [Rhodospirillaceae bacterium]MBT6588459.1 acyl carrier protein [Rhodospirillaceae bacterium]